MIEYGPKLITNGLILSLDAANTKSYSGTASKWHDLKSYYDVTLNGTSFSNSNYGSVVFNGTSDYGFASNSVLFPRVLSEMSILCFLKRNGSQFPYTGIVYSRGTSVTGLDLSGDGSKVNYTWNNTAYDFDSGLTIPDNTWCMIGVVVNSSTGTLYLNSATAVNVFSHASTTIDNLYVGEDTTGGRYFKGNIAYISMYDRALSSTEVLQNYNALKTRFNL